MSTPILATKLYMPPPRPHLIARPRLLERLNAGRQRKLTLISAPAGFGKTTLVSDWIKQKDEGGRMKDEGDGQLHPSSSILHPFSVAWLSLDEGDREPYRFLAYLVAALQTIAPTLGEGVRQMLGAPQPPAVEALLLTLINDIAALVSPFLLVLDDYHLSATVALDEALTFLLEHLPPQAHLVITTREDPNLPLARYRVRDQLTEVRADDLRFTADEAAAFLRSVMGLTLSVAEVAALEARTEGWIAALQLAALSMRGRADVAGFIQAFTGDNRYIVDYLIEEVLQRQPDPIRQFLYQTAILDRLNGALCAAVTGQADSKRVLELLERSNLFVIPLDDKRHWYRYHHLFAEVLHARLLEEQPDQVLGLHQRASIWYEQNGQPAAAIQHALAATDFPRAALLIELAWPAMRKSRQEATVLRWLTALPEALVRSRPVLSVAYALTLLDEGALAAAERRLLEAEAWIANRSPSPSTADLAVADAAQLRALPAAIANARAYHAQALGDIANTVNYTQQALTLLPADDYYERGTAAALLGLAYWASGQLEAAHTSFADGLVNLQRAGGIQIAMGGATILAELRRAQGRLVDAYRTYEQALRLTVGPAHALALAMADLHRGLSEIYLDWGDLKTAAQHLSRSKELGQQTGLQGDAWRWAIAQARWLAAQGEVAEALTLLTEAEAIYFKTPIPDVRPLAAIKARLWLTQGRLAEALAWARTAGVAASDELSYLREYEQITLARILLAQGVYNRAARPLHEALALLARLYQAAEAGERRGSQLEILILQALAHAAQGDRAAALGALAHALPLAEPEGYIQIFVDEGPAMVELLARLKEEGGRLKDENVQVYIDKILAAFGPQPAADGSAAPTSAQPSPHPSSPIPHPFLDPLSERELDVLRLFKSELSGPEIARELVIALSTLRTHTKNIYSKLNVNSRRAAVNRATELGLL